MEIRAFDAWISDAENAQTLSLKEAKSKWTLKKKQFQKLSSRLSVNALQNIKAVTGYIALVNQKTYPLGQNSNPRTQNKSK